MLGKKTGGRTKGTPNKHSAWARDLADGVVPVQPLPPNARREMTKRALRAALDEGIMPLDIMRARMRDEPLPNGRLVTDTQFAAACAAAPFLHPKLQAVVVKDVTVPATPGAVDQRIQELLRKGLGGAITIDGERADDSACGPESG